MFDFIVSRLSRGKQNSSVIKVYHFSQLPNVQCCWAVLAKHIILYFNGMPYKESRAPLLKIDIVS